MTNPPPGYPPPAGPSGHGQAAWPQPPMPGAPPYGAPGQHFATQLGDIVVSNGWITTPLGQAPLAGSTWSIVDMTRIHTKIPTWAIVMAIVGSLFCFIGLFFLLVREEEIHGYVEVRVQTTNLLHMTQIPPHSPYHIDQLRHQIGQIQAQAWQLGRDDRST